MAIAVSERLLARGATWAYRVWEVAMAESAEDREQEDPRARWRKLPPRRAFPRPCRKMTRRRHRTMTFRRRSTGNWGSFGTSHEP